MNGTIFGIFDSGLGGISVLSSVLKRHGDIPCLYLADTERVPYGEKTFQEIRFIAMEVALWLSSNQVSNVLMACNTTNSLALDLIKKFSGVPVIGLIESAAQMVKEDRVGILCTPATATSFSYQNQILARRPGTVVVQQACPELVPLIESQEISRDEISSAIERNLRPLLAANVEAIVLGCSHYPLVESIFKELLPKSVRLIDPALGLASKLDQILGGPCKVNDQLDLYRNTRFCATSHPENFAKRAGLWLGKCPEVELISLRSKAGFL